MDPRRLETGFFIVLLVLALFLTWMVFQPYLSVLILAGTLAFLFYPIYEKLIKIFHFQSLAAVVVVFIVTVIVFVPLSLFGVRIFAETTALYTSLTSNGGFDLGATVTHFISTNFPGFQSVDIASNVNDAVRQGLTWLIQNLGFFFSGLAQALFVAFLSLFGLFYFLRDGDRLKEWLLKIIPLTPKYTEGIIHEMEAVLGSVVKGTLLMAVIQGVVAGIGFLIFGIPDPAFWGALTVLTTLVPIVGTWLVVVPAIGYLFFTGSTTLAICLAIWSVILVNLIYNLIAPQLMHRGVKIHPFVILLSVLGGIGVFGPIGFLVGPLVVALLFSLLNIYPKMVAKKTAK